MVTFHFIRFFCLTAVLVRFDCLQRLQLNRITRSKTSVTAISTRRLEIGSILTRAASLIVGSTIPFLFQLDFGGIDQEHLTFQSSPQCAHADSTGKMSTKLTARKRYLPRVKAGVTEFKKLSQSLDKESLTAFSTDSVSFVRAMDLYGVSLRKGETPDEISRTAKQLTDTFAKEIKLLDKTVGEAKILSQYKISILALDNYLEYAKLPISSDESY